MSLKGVFIATNAKRDSIDLYLSEFNSYYGMYYYIWNLFLCSLKIVPAFLDSLVQSHRLKNYLVRNDNLLALIIPWERKQMVKSLTCKHGTMS